MAIADTIQSMYDNVGEVYDTITNVDINNGKNLFDYNKITTSAYYTNNYDGSFTRNSNGSSITINVDTASVPYDTFSLLAGTYSLSFDITTTSAVTFYSLFLCTKQNGTGSNLAKSIGVQIPANTTTHIKAENYVVLNNAEKVGFAGYLSASTGVVISNIQVEKGTTATEYQPYTDNPTYKNIENIPSTMRNSYLEIMNNGIDTIWNNWEKVEGTGETLTLNSTEEAPMKIDLKGNTSQATTTGKNLLIPHAQATASTNGITRTTNADGSITLTGTATANAYLRISEPIQLQSSTTYTTLIQDQELPANVTLYYNNLENIGTDYASTYMPPSTRAKTYTTGNVTGTINIAVLVQSGASVNVTLKPMLVKGTYTTSNIPPYEPYTNGASPNPDYPQDIHVVSGDNSIDVCGKNLMDNKAISGVQNGVAYTINQDKSITLNGTSTQAFIFDIDNGRTLEAGTYTLSLKGKILGCGIYLYENNTLKAYVSSNWTNDKNTFTLDKKTTFNEIRIDVQVNKTFNNITIYPMIEKGNQATTYEPYQGASYPISLGVENLYNLPNEETLNGITYTKNANGSINLIGTATANTSFMIYKDLATTNIINGNTYTLSATQSLPNGVEIRLEAYNGTTWLRHILNSALNSTQQKITNNANTTNATRVRYLIYVASGTSVNITNLEIQLGIGTNKVSSTPIELCKIGDYQDSIKKSTGKNLFNKDNVNELNATINSSGVISSNNNCKTIYIPIKPNTTYTIQKVLSTQFRASVYDEEPQINSTGTNTIANFSGTIITITSTTNSKYLALFCYINTDTQTYQQILDSIMINEGSTALPYEPYGKVWYLNKQIGKVVLDGSEEWKIGGTYSGITQFDVNANTTNIPETILKVLSNYFRGVVWKNSWTINKCISIGLNIMRIMTSDYTTVADFKTWLSTHNTTVYYALATPTYTEITDTTLLSQLEAVKKSYTTQTNISQENNDKPFILDVTALKQLTQ